MSLVKLELYLRSRQLPIQKLACFLWCIAKSLIACFVGGRRELCWSCASFPLDSCLLQVRHCMPKPQNPPAWRRYVVACFTFQESFHIGVSIKHVYLRSSLRQLFVMPWESKTCEAWTHLQVQKAPRLKTLAWKLRNFLCWEAQHWELSRSWSVDHIYPQPSLSFNELIGAFLLSQR